MDQDEEEHMQQFEDYCRKLGLQVRNESDVSSMAVDEVSVLGVAVSEGEKPDEDSLPIPAGHAKLQATNYSHFDCKDCSRRFASSRQFVKHKCLSKTEEGLAKSPGKKPGRKPRPRKRAKAAKAERRGEDNAADTTKAESLSLKGDNIDHSSDQLSIKGTNDHDDVSDQIADDGVQNTDCDSCQLLPELDPGGNIKSKKIPCEKCLELNVSGTPASEKNKMSGEKVKKRKYGFKTEKQLCPHCNQGFHSAKRYEKHLTICRKNLLCSFCGKDFSNNGRMAYVQYQAHYYTHVEQKPFSCEICKRGFIRKADLDRHKIIHTEEYEPQRCEQCGAVFSTKENLEKHKKKHEQPRWVCTKCRQTFARESACEKHMKNCQTQINCEICGKKFQCLSKNIKSRYQEHMYTHTGEKPYKCQFCERGFRDRSTRRKHERTHTGEKPYPCTICERAFSQLRLLRNHVRTHTGEKPYACELCELSFAKSCNLKYHMRVHTKEKPYSCDICQKSFTQSGTYHKHMRRHKGVAKDNAATTIQFESSSTTTNDISAKAQFPSNAGTETDQKPDESFNTADRTISPDAAQSIVGNKEMESSPLVCPEIASDTSEIVIKDNSPPAQDSPAQVGEMPLSGEEITIIVSEGDGVTAALASIDVDQISSILASCS